MIPDILEKVVREEAAKVFDSNCYETVIFNGGRGTLVLYVYLWETDGDDFMNPPIDGTIEQVFPYECIHETNFRKKIRDVLKYKKDDLEKRLWKKEKKQI